MLTATDLTIGYKNGRSQTIVAQNINITLQPNQLVCLLGPNGVGKSTLMRTLAGMQKPLTGAIQLNGENLENLSAQQLAKILSVVLTEKINVGMLSAYALVALGRHPYTGWDGKLSPQDERIVQEAIIAVGAEPLADRYVNELSDGERQKIMIARALAQSPKLMILDEPTAYLDLPRRVEIAEILRRLAHRGNCTVLLSTHDLDLAMRTADQIWLMENGRLHIGAPEDLILSGTFARAFASEGVTFDNEKGVFNVAQSQIGEIQLIGEGLKLKWTTHALERAGYSVVHEDLNASTQVICEDEAWVLKQENGRFTHNSIESLINALSKTKSSR